MVFAQQITKKCSEKATEAWTFLIALRQRINLDGKKKFAFIKKHNNLMLYIPIDTAKAFMWINCLSTV